MAATLWDIGHESRENVTLLTKGPIPRLHIPGIETAGVFEVRRGRGTTYEGNPGAWLTPCWMRATSATALRYNPAKFDRPGGLYEIAAYSVGVSFP